ncbi:DMT family transporter [Haloglomus litoreum]|uniref:DMT family transporter n=1 Tax=Haloglomus litoreum TaxID=3034026 RepID=UPI0023E80D67|nr:DMT family transporter [Haloglomus sp. DT116]
MSEPFGSLSTSVPASGLAFAVGATLFSSLVALAIRAGTDTDTAGSQNALLVVLLTNVVLILPVAVVSSYPDFGLTPTSVGAFAMAGVVGTLLGRSLSYASIERIGASRTAPIKSSQPLHATLIAMVVLGEQVTPLHMAGIVLIVGGVAVVSWDLSRSSADSSVDASPYELLVPLGAAFFYGLEPIFAKTGINQGTPVAVGLAIKTLVALVGYTLVMRVRWTLPDPRTFDATQLRWYVLAGLFNTAFLASFYLAIQVAPVSVVVPVVTTSPLVIVALSRAFLPDIERVTWRVAAGAVVVVAGGVLTTLYG